jgi:hypothetical protein
MDRLYLPRKADGRGLLQVRQIVGKEKRALNDYINKNSKEKALKEVAKEELLKVQETKADYRAQARTEDQNRKVARQSTPRSVHQRHRRKSELYNNTWNWLTNGELKKETEGFILAAQDQALRTNVIKVKIDKTCYLIGSPLSRLSLNNALSLALTNKLNDFKKAAERLRLLHSRDVLVILKHSVNLLSLLYNLRNAPVC